jgi:hypothetical protein
MTILFPNNENIWKLSDPTIPTMYISGDNHEFERPANIQINLKQQIQLSSEVIFVFKPDNTTKFFNIKMKIFYIFQKLVPMS